MALNKSTGNMYSFVTHTWNTVKGDCPHNCSYCYMKRWGKQSPIHFDEKELKTDLGDGNFIFVGSSCDMWAADVPYLWLMKTTNHCKAYPNNDYLFQTKNPERILNNLSMFPAKSIICTTIETNRQYEQMADAPSTFERAKAMSEIPLRKFVTIEPIMDFDLDLLVGIIKLANPEQVNIGCDSGNNNLPEPPKEKVLELISELEKFTIIHSKKNLARLLK